MNSEGFQELASILNPAIDIPTGETPLLAAMGAVGKVLGIPIRSPLSLSTTRNPVEAIAHASGCRVRRITLTEGWWRSYRGPLLGWIQPENRPVALLPKGRKQYEILDSVNLQRIPLNRRTAQQLASTAYVLYRPFPDKKLTTLEVLKFALFQKTRDLISLLILGGIIALLGMLTPQAIGLLIDQVIPDANQTLLLQIGLGLLAASFGMATLQLAQSLVMLRTQILASADTQAAIWDRLLKLKLSFFRQYSAGDLQNRLSAIEQIQTRLSSTIIRTLLTSFFSLLNLGLLFLYSWKLALIVTAIAGLAGFFAIITRWITYPKMRSLQQLNGEIFGIVVQFIAGISKLRVAGAEQKAFDYWAKKYSSQVKLMLSTQGVMDTVILWNTVMPTITSILLFSFTVMLIQQSTIAGETGLSTGDFLAFNAAFGTFIAAVIRLSNTLIDAIEIMILWERTQPILQAELEVNMSKSDPGELSGQLKLNNVSFRYRSDSSLVLDGVTLEAKPGEFIAIVGPSGSGKSTIMRLLLGFETPETGSVFYDNRDLAQLDVTLVRKQLGVVLQDSRVLSGSIWEIIAGGAVITPESAMEAIMMAGLAEDVQAMPMGIHTIVSEGGGNLSGGQRQRLLIARALVHQPKILLFDEATSALDNRTQAIVTQSLEQLGVTRIVIAHRLSTIRHADRIYLLEAGRVVKQGSFEELTLS